MSIIKSIFFTQRKTLRFIHWNVCSINQKSYNQKIKCIKKYTPHIVSINQSRNSMQKFKQSQTSFQIYEAKPARTQNNQKYNSVILIDKNLKAKIQLSKVHQDFISLNIKLPNMKIPILIVCQYINPMKNKEDKIKCLQLAQTQLNKFYAKYNKKRAIVAGDFNLSHQQLKKLQIIEQKFSKIHNLMPSFSGQTSHPNNNYQGRQVDHVFSNFFKLKHQNIITQLSDHSLLFFQFQIQKQKLTWPFKIIFNKKLIILASIISFWVYFYQISQFLSQKQKVMKKDNQFKPILSNAVNFLKNHEKDYVLMDKKIKDYGAQILKLLKLKAKQ